MYLNEEPEYIKETAMLIEEMLKQRILGMKNEAGVYITPAFPKLLYVTDENNIYENSEYYYLTKLAAECVSKRMMPDFISAKIMKEAYDGEVFPCMGCVSGSSVITYKYKGLIEVEPIEKAWNRLSGNNKIKQQPSPQENNPNEYMDLVDCQIYDTKKEGFVKLYRMNKNVSTEWLKVTFDDGKYIKCTPDHPFSINGGIILAKDLTPGLRIITNPHQYSLPPKNVKSSEKRSWLYGFLLVCDKTIKDKKNLEINIKNLNKETIEYLKVSLISQAKCDPKIIKNKIVIENVFLLIQNIALIQDMFLSNTLFETPDKIKASFISGIIDCIGVKTEDKIEITLQDEGLSNQIQALLRNLRIFFALKNDTTIRFKITQDIKDIITNETLKLEPTETRTDIKPFYVSVESIESIKSDEKYSYDVSTSSEHFEVNGIYSHNCRSFLNAYKNEKGEYQYYGRFNVGVTTLNVPYIALLANKDMDKFYELLKEYADLCFESLKLRYERLKDINPSIAPMHWKYGTLTRVKDGESIEKYLKNGYCTYSLGYAGINEATQALIGEPISSEGGHKLGLEIVSALRRYCDEWYQETNLFGSLYGTPLEASVYKFAKALQNKFGKIKDISDHDYITNSHHVCVREEISPFKKLKLESEFQNIASGGYISYIETCNLSNNIQAILDIIKYMYENVKYAELNGKFDHCNVCGYDGEILVNDKNEWYCPECGNKDTQKLNVARRTCGKRPVNYL